MIPNPLFLLPTTLRWIVSPPHKREYFLLPTGAGSILYRPMFFHPIVFDQRFRELTKAQDDITFRLGTNITATHSHRFLYTCHVQCDTRYDTLFLHTILTRCSFFLFLVLVHLFLIEFSHDILANSDHVVRYRSIGWMLLQ